jgi:Transposase
MNTVKRYDRADAPGKLRRAAQYRPTLVDPYHDYLRKRRAEEPGAPARQLLREIRELGYPGSSNLLVRYLNQGRADAPRSHLSPRRAARHLLSRPDNLNDAQRATAARLASSCPEMKALASLIGSFAALLDPDPGNEEKLQPWITEARAADLPQVHSFTRGLDLEAVTAALTLPHHNGRTEGVNCKTKMLKRQMFGRAGFELLRHRILLGLDHGTSPPKPRQSRIYLTHSPVMAGRKADLVARFGGIPLRQNRKAAIRDPAPARIPYPRKELVRRLRKRICELCETGTTVTVHQVTGLKTLGQPGPGQPAWAALMARMRRKTLVVCAGCHEHIHAAPVALAA